MPMILHVDMDAFYASIEQRDRPELRGRPVAVGGTRSRGVVAAASYEARACGVHSAMPAGRAKRLCPQIVFVPCDLQRYRQVGHQVREIFLRFTPRVQPLSLDEAFLDVTDCRRLHGDATAIGWQIKGAIARELGLSASVGVAPRKFIAKIASDLNKPDGFVEVTEAEIQDFLDPLSVERLWGVGAVGSRRLREIGCTRIGDLRRHSRDSLQTQFGHWGAHLWDLAHGIDPRVVTPDRQAKQISHERTFGRDLEDPQTLSVLTSQLCEQVAGRLRASRQRCKTVRVKYRREDFRTFSRSESFPEATNVTGEISAAAQRLLTQLRQTHPGPVRLLGVSACGLASGQTPQQKSLFGETESETTAKRIDQLVDTMRAKIGGDAIHRGSSHRRPEG